MCRGATFRPRADAGALTLREPHHHAARRSSVFSQARRLARQTIDELENQYVEEELVRAKERAELDEAWALLHERVESCRRKDAAARALREEAVRFAAETRASVKQEAAEAMAQLEEAREALEAETASKHQEMAALEQQTLANSKAVEEGLKQLREGLEIGRASCRERVCQYV